MADFGSESEGERASDEIVAERMCTASEIEKKEVDNSERIESDLNSLNASSDLLALKVSELRKRAEAAGVGLEKVDEAGDDEKNPKDKMILLIKEAEAVRSSENDKLRGLKLQEELQAMKISQLRLRAAEAGVSPERIDEANDAKLITRHLLARGGVDILLCECVCSHYANVLHRELLGVRRLLLRLLSEDEVCDSSRWLSL